MARKKLQAVGGSSDELVSFQTIYTKYFLSRVSIQLFGVDKRNSVNHHQSLAKLDAKAIKGQFNQSIRNLKASSPLPSSSDSVYAITKLNLSETEKLSPRPAKIKQRRIILNPIDQNTLSSNFNVENNACQDFIVYISCERHLFPLNTLDETGGVTITPRVFVLKQGMQQQIAIQYHLAQNFRESLVGVQGHIRICEMLVKYCEVDSYLFLQKQYKKVLKTANRNRLNTICTDFYYNIDTDLQNNDAIFQRIKDEVLFEAKITLVMNRKVEV